MKVYVIKNKEGKYFERGLSNFYNPNFCEEHYFYETKQDAEKSIEFYRLEDCEVVEIIIVEGDLKQGQILINGRFNGKRMVMELQKQLAEKDKEIKELKEKEYWTEKGLKLRDIFIRHQVCDEIRKKAEIFGAGPIGKIGYLIKDELLNKIEKTEVK